MPDVHSLPRSSSLEGCIIPCDMAVADTLSLLGIHEQPYHLLVGSASHAPSTQLVKRHVWSGRLPRRSLIKITPTVLCPSPELCFAQLAQETARAGTPCSGERWGKTHCRFPWIDEVSLALLGFELCGTYLLRNDEDGVGSKGFVNTPRALTDAESIRRVLSALGRFKGAKLARDAAGLVQNGSHSPMETAMALQLTGPRRVGGMGLPRGELNCKIVTPSGDRWVDLGWKRQGVGIEYLGRDWHTDAEADDRRRNGIVGSGMNLFIARFKDLSAVDLFDTLSKGLARALGVRLRVRSKDFRARRAALWAKVLPSPTRWE